LRRLRKLAAMSALPNLFESVMPNGDGDHYDG
jgi:hypothetical protein